MTELPNRPKETLPDRLKKLADFDTKKYSSSLNLFNVACFVTAKLLSCTNNNVIATVITNSNVIPAIIIAANSIMIGNPSALTQGVVQTSPVQEMKIQSIGGPVDIFFASDFLMVDDNYICDEDVWQLGAGETSSSAVYSSSVFLESAVQFDFVPTGSSSANIAFSRPELFEVVLGESSFGHISVKDLRTNELMDVWRVGEGTDGIGNRYPLEEDLSPSEMNNFRLQERFVTDTDVRIHMTVNDVEYITEPFKVINPKKYKTITLSLIDYSNNHDNLTGLYSPTLRICN